METVLDMPWDVFMKIREKRETLACDKLKALLCKVTKMKLHQNYDLSPENEAIYRETASKYAPALENFLCGKSNFDYHYPHKMS